MTQRNCYYSPSRKFSREILKLVRKMSSMVALIALSVLPGRAVTTNAASCSNIDVQAAINRAAPTGDTVVVPAGSCTWTSTVTIVNKGLTLQGAGIGVTNIDDQGSGGAALNVSGLSDVNFVRVTGFTFIKDTNHSGGMIQFVGNDNTNATELVGFRFDHNRILVPSTGSRGFFPQSIMGLIDNNTFDVTAPNGSNQVVTVDGSSENSDGGWTPWTQPLTLGTNKAVYIEDNTFTVNIADAGVEDQIDATSGARLVIRHNQFNNSSVGFHGTDSGSIRSPFSAEVYSNTFTNSSAVHLRGGTMRGGTGVWYNNTYSGSGPSWYGITLMSYRSCPLVGSTYAWGTCDGTKWKLNSIDHTLNVGRVNSVTGTAMWCANHPDTACTTDADCPGSSCSRYFDGTGASGYPCRDQIGRTHDQALSPVYAWGNTGAVALGSYDGGNTSCDAAIGNALQAGRDFIDNTQMPGYTAYTYPHPLQNAGSAPAAPPAPTGLSAVAN